MAEKKHKGLTRLTQPETDEISLVPRGANRRRFLILKKSEEKKVADPAANLSDMIAKADPSVMSKVDQCIKAHMAKAVPPTPVTGATPPQNPPLAVVEPAEGAAGVKKDGPPAEAPVMDAQAQAAVKAVVRILLPFKDKVSPDLLFEVLDAAGFQLTGQDEEATEDGGMGDDGEIEMSFHAIPAMVESEKEDVLDDGVKKSDFHAAVQKANDVYKECMKAAGYEKYPSAEMAKKNSDGKTVATKGEQVAKSGTAQPDLSQVDPATRAKVEQIFKSQQELITKNSDLEKRLSDRDAADRRRELVQKASTFTHLGLPQDDLVEQLVVADKAGKEALERVVKSFTTLNEQAKASNLFQEVGSSGSGGGTGDNAWGKIETLAKGIVQKSTQGLTHAQAVDMVLNSPEGQALYKQHQQSRKDGI